MRGIIKGMQKNYIFFTIVIVIVALLGYRIYLGNRAYHEPQAVIEPQNSSAAASSQQQGLMPSVSVQTQGTGTYRVEALPLPKKDAQTISIPSLDRPITFPAGFPDEAKKIMSDKISATAAALKKDAQRYDDWLNLGIFRKQIDDFEGARQIWEFLTTTNPDKPIPFANLANLYAFDLKNPALAEENFIKALAKGPKEMFVWRQAYEFYRYVRKDDAKAKDMLQKGIAQTNSPDLKYLLDHYSEL